jgi:uncharacterized protein YkwD
VYVFWVSALFLAGSPEPEPLLPAVNLQVQREFERVGRGIPARDAALEQAAERVARIAVEQGAARAADAARVSHEVSASGGYDPSPRALVIRASPPERALESLRARTDLNEEPASHLGVAVVQRGEEAVVVVLLADRKAQLDPVPRVISELGAARAFCGTLRAPLQQAEVYVTRPTGTVDKVPVTREEGARFCSTLAFPGPGEHSVEVIGHGPSGPEVTALFFVEVGSEQRPAVTQVQPEPTSISEAREQLLSRINALRAASGVPPLASNDALNAVAQAYSERMAKEHFFAHVAPDGTTLSLRLRRVNFAYRRAGENLGLAAGPLSAHAGIEQSPGHRRNLLEPEFEQLGIGVAPEQVGNRTQVIVAEVLATPMRAAEDAVIAVHRAVARRRAQLGLPALKRTEALDALALERAREALSQGRPDAEPSGSPMEKRVFAAVEDAETTSMDLFLADHATFVPESPALKRRTNNRVGVGAVKGRAPGIDREKLWVVVIYTGSR